ncbi:dicarboxylate carrier SLC25A8-like [Neocloeon triangulifer]|uniref:dicarboxylate carrier SLC25A8-like n=1 Tax=Neocloeon triangulifer TaxID=2078957 RepID=UPI00286F5868|nr:dicarboxylate carrier SLC25A8-like [Neocloeon triangulifer]
MSQIPKLPTTAVTVTESPLYVKLLTAGTAACVADFVTFPLDTAKVRLQVQGEGRAVIAAAMATSGQAAVVVPAGPQYRGLVGTIATMARQEGARSLYNGLSAGLQRQMCFASVRLGLYDTTKAFYQQILDGGNPKVAGSIHVGTRIAAGFTTGALAVLLAQPTDVVKVRFQAAQKNSSSPRYKSTLQAYKTIAKKEGARGLWKGTFPNVGRNAIVNVSEIVCYDIIKETIIKNNLMTDNVPCHFTSAVIAGFCTTVFASPVDVVKTRYMNSAPGTYKGAIDCAIRMFSQEGHSAFYKGFTPSFYRLVSWNIVLWITYEQLKKTISNSRRFE